MLLLIRSLSNINSAIIKKSLILFEKYNSCLVKVLTVLWKKNLIVGYNVKNDLIKIILKYNTSGKSIIKYLHVLSKSSILKTKKKKTTSSYILLISNSLFGYNLDSDFGKLILKVEI